MRHGAPAASRLGSVRSICSALTNGRECSRPSSCPSSLRLCFAELGTSGQQDEPLNIKPHLCAGGEPLRQARQQPQRVGKRQAQQGGLQVAWLDGGDRRAHVLAARHAAHQRVGRQRLLAVACGLSPIRLHRHAKCHGTTAHRGDVPQMRCTAHDCQAGYELAAQGGSMKNRQA